MNLLFGVASEPAGCRGGIASTFGVDMPFNDGHARVGCELRCISAVDQLAFRR